MKKLHAILATKIYIVFIDICIRYVLQESWNLITEVLECSVKRPLVRDCHVVDYDLHILSAVKRCLQTAEVSVNGHIYICLRQKSSHFIRYP